MTVLTSDGGQMHVSLARLYRVTSLVWLTVMIALGLSACGSALLHTLEPAQDIAVVLTVITGAGMALRAVVPGRPEWTRWTLPLTGFTSVSTSVLSLFAVEFAHGGYTSARVGYTLLLLAPGLFAYIHWVGEKVVAPR